MKNNFSFYELYTSQWSFKNEGITLSVYVCISFVLCLVASFDIGFDTFFVWWPITTLWFFSIYQGIKVLVFIPVCYGVCYYAKQGDPTFVQRYKEMLIWRK